MSNWFQKLGFGLKKTSTRLTSGITDIFIKRKVDSQTLEELEDLLITSDLGVKAAQKIISSFASRRLNKDADEQEIKTELANDIETILNPCEQPFLITNEKPYVILMVGVNGAGKTTTIGKLAAKLKGKHQISLIAADTFRAAAVEQLEIWGQRNNIRVYKGSNGCDAAALCFDGLKEALKQDDDIVFIDTAGRLQNKTGLMDELKKIVKVIKKIIPDAPHATLLTIDATTGQNALNQVKTFKEMVDVSGLIVTKLDGTAKGGIIVAVAEETGIPIHYIGIGEGIDQLRIFDRKEFVNALFGHEKN
mgnify:FL=1